MTAKEYLKQVESIDRQIQLDNERLTEIRSALYGRGVRYENNGSKPVLQNNGFEKAMQRLLESEECLNAEICKLIAKRVEIEKAVAAVPDSVQREVLTRKYLMSQEWEDISRKMNYSIQHIYRLHAIALRNFQKMRVNESK